MQSLIASLLKVSLFCSCLTLCGDLDQRFTYLGSGGQFTAYLGDDGKTVLKLLKPLPQNEQRPIIASASLAYAQLKDLAALTDFHPPSNTPCRVRLRNEWGFSRDTDIGNTPFLLQQKAEPLLPTLEKLLKQRKIDEAKQVITSVVELLSTCSSRAIGDYDNALRRNIGILEGKAVFIDVGSFHEDPSLLDPTRAHQELILKTRRLHRWLKKHHPELLPHLEQTLN